MEVVRYNIPTKGLGTELSLPKESTEYARVFRNRFINLNQEAEKRPGLKVVGSQIPGQPLLDGIHEFIDDHGNPTLFVSGEGKIWRYSTTTSDWESTPVLMGKDKNARMISVQFGDKLIFVNGVDRNFYTKDKGTTFKELQPIITSGTMGAGTSSTEVTDPQITNWASQTFLSANDVVYNADTSVLGMITSVGSTDLDVTPMGGAGASGVGVGSANSTGNQYEIYDLVALNIIPTKLDPDNVALLTSAAGIPVNASSISVSGVNFANTMIKVGDFILNTTRNVATQVLSVSAGLRVVDVSGQVAGDTITLHKKAMPISDWACNHFKRIYLTDVREPSKVRVSGIDDPQDFTTFQKTIESASIDYGSRYSKGGSIISISTFNAYLVAGGNHQIFVDEGTNPIQDTASAVSTNLSQIGGFDQGVVSRFGLLNIGSDMVYASFDGLRSFRAAFTSGNVTTNNVSEQIKSELREAIASQLTSPDGIQLIHYYRRNWVLFKIGDIIYTYNYTPNGAGGMDIAALLSGSSTSHDKGTWSTFTGKIAECNAYTVRNNGDLLMCDSNGKVFIFDQGNYDDAGANISTDMETLWLTTTEPQSTVRWKSGKYIKPTFQTGAEITYTIRATGNYDSLSTDSINVTGKSSFVIGQAVINQATIGGNAISYQKLPLRWRGEQFKLRFSTDDTKGNDTISQYYVYGEIDGRT